MGQPGQKNCPVRCLSAGLLLTVLPLGLFVLLGHLAGSTGGPTDFDAHVSARFEDFAHAHPGLLPLVVGITDVGSGMVPLAIALGGTIVLAGLKLRRRADYGLIAFWIMTTLAGGLLSGWLKEIYQRPRPQFQQPLVHHGDLSFPSGDALRTFMVYGALAYLAVRLLPRGRLRAGALAGLASVILAVGMSRVYLGAHWPTDVLGGYLVGAAWLALWITVAELSRPARDAAVPGA